MFKVATLYKFVALTDLEALQQALEKIGQAKELIGTLLIAPEGINGTIAGRPTMLEDAIAQIQAITPFHDIFHQYATAEEKPFTRLKIKVKQEIITMSQTTASTSPRAQPIVAADWNECLDQASVVVDVRNNYEYRVGTFQHALNPKTNCFREFPIFVERSLANYKDQPIALFCTGGIRCEKASAYMLAQGFEEVYQLSGGILQYLAHIPRAETRWQGECFVFDRRITLDHGLEKGKCLLCYGCRMPLTTADIDKDYKPGIQCKYCSEKKAPYGEA